MPEDCAEMRNNKNKANILISHIYKKTAVSIRAHGGLFFLLYLLVKNKSAAIIPIMAED